MSTDRQRLQDAIRRIAKQDPDLSALIGASKNKGGQASSTGIGVSDAERDNLCCDGTTGGGANAGTDQRDPDQDGEDGLDDADPAELTMGQGSLTGVTDCATGLPVCFNGGGFIPPDGWDDPNTPPIDPAFEDGFYYIGEITPIGQTGENDVAFQAASEAKNHVCPSLCLCVESNNLDISICTGCSSASGSFLTNCGGNTYRWVKHDCSEIPDPICEEPPPVASFWPSDSCVNLAIQGGKIVGSKFDPENDSSYSAPRDEIELCDPSGNRILLRGSPTGGWKSIKSLDGDIDPDTGNGYLYRPNGQRVRQISPSEFRDDTV